MTKRDHGEGSIQQRGPNTHRLRYRIEQQRFEKTFHGSATEARKELRRLLKAGDDGAHVAPTKVTVGQWIDMWIAAGCPGRRRKKVSQRTAERYSQLLLTHVKPVLGNRPLQQLRAVEIDNLYSGIAAAAVIAPRTQHHVHVVFGALLATAERKAMISANPMLRVEQVPNAEARVDGSEAADDDEDDFDNGLDEAELAKLIAGFKPSPSHYAPVATAAATGARRNELLALKWADLNVEARTLRIERALEQTKKFHIRVKPPKTRRGLRTISLDPATIALLLEEKARHQRLVAGIPDGVEVDLSLVRLPAGALMFPASPVAGKDVDLCAWRNPRNFSKEFARRAKRLGFAGVKFHTLRGTHATALLDAGIPVNRVAERIGDDPITLMRSYAKKRRTKTADDKMSDAIEALSAGFLKS